MSALDELVARVERHQREEWPQTPVGRYSAERALLERDVRDVAYHARKLEEFIGSAESLARLTDVLLNAKVTYAGYDLEVYRYRDGVGLGHDARAMLADCQAWLARAKAVLG